MSAMDRAVRLCAFADNPAQPSPSSEATPAPDTNATAARVANIPPTPVQDPAADAELKRNFEMAGRLGATGTPLFVIGDRVLNGAVGYDALKQAVEAAQKKS